MIFILSDESDKSTYTVIDWIKHLSDIEIVRINKEDFVSSTNVSISDKGIDFLLVFGKKKVQLSKIGAHWYRRGMLVCHPMKIFKDNKGKEWLNKFSKQLEEDSTTLFQFIHQQLKGKYNINCFEDNFLNKLIVLSKAQKSGLKIPFTVITTNTRQIRTVYKKRPVITKSITNQLNYTYEDEVFVAATERVNFDETDLHAPYSLPSLFQNEIEKQFEIRIFFLDSYVFSMAIFSQNDEQTKLDYRNYNFHKMNRMIPFVLPKDVETKIQTLMKELCLSSGSIDMIYDKQGDYIFLEVNPIGQFGMVSSRCNYYLEKLIAESLIKNHSNE